MLVGTTGDSVQRKQLPRLFDLSSTGLTLGYCDALLHPLKGLVSRDKQYLVPP